MPFKFIHITDTHLANPGLKLYGLDPRARLDAAIADINKHHADAAFAVVSGDLTHWGEADSYANFADAMAALEMPYIAMVGNHDRRVACLDGLKAAPRCQRLRAGHAHHRARPVRLPGYAGRDQPCRRDVRKTPWLACQHARRRADRHAVHRVHASSALPGRRPRDGRDRAGAGCGIC